MLTFGKDIEKVRNQDNAATIPLIWQSVDIEKLASEATWQVKGSDTDLNGALESYRAILYHDGVAILTVTGPWLRKMSHNYAVHRARLVISVWEEWAKYNAPEHFEAARKSVEAKELWCQDSSHDNDDKARWCGEDAYRACLFASRAWWNGDATARNPSEAVRAAYYASDWKSEVAGKFAGRASAEALEEWEHFDYERDFMIFMLGSVRDELTKS